MIGRHYVGFSCDRSDSYAEGSFSCRRKLARGGIGSYIKERINAELQKSILQATFCSGLIA
jgi:hypothetical protein